MMISGWDETTKKPVPVQVDSLGVVQTNFIPLADARYLKTDQTTPQTVINGKPTFDAGLISGLSGNVIIGLATDDTINKLQVNGRAVIGLPNSGGDFIDQGRTLQLNANNAYDSGLWNKMGNGAINSSIAHQGQDFSYAQFFRYNSGLDAYGQPMNWGNYANGYAVAGSTGFQTNDSVNGVLMLDTFYAGDIIFTTNSQARSYPNLTIKNTGETVVQLDNADYINNAGVGAVLALLNPNANGQNVVYSEINGQMVAKWRTDYVGNISWIANATHNFYVGGDYGTGIQAMHIDTAGRLLVNEGTYAPDIFEYVIGTNSFQTVGNADIANTKFYTLNGQTGFILKPNPAYDTGYKGFIFGRSADGSSDHDDFFLYDVADNTFPMLYDASNNFGFGGYNPSTDATLNAMWICGTTGNVIVGKSTDDGIGKLQVSGDIVSESANSSYPDIKTALSIGSVKIYKDDASIPSAGLQYDTVNGILDYSINVPQWGVGEDASKVGGIFRVDTRAGAGAEGFYIFSYGVDVGAGRPQAYELYINFNDGTTWLNPTHGNTLIGTTTNDGVNKLQVNGTIKTESMKVNSMPTYDPMDGSGTLWYDTSTNLVYRGT